MFSFIIFLLVTPRSTLGMSVFIPILILDVEMDILVIPDFFKCYCYSTVQLKRFIIGNISDRFPFIMLRRASDL